MISALVFFLMVVFVCLIFKGAYNIIRAVFLRIVFLHKLKKLCTSKKFRLAFVRNPISSFFKISSTPDMILKSDTAEYVIRLITCRKRKRIWYFINEGLYVRVFRVFFMMRYSHRADPFDISKKLGHIPALDKKYADHRKNVVPVYIFNPSPTEINYINEDNEKLTAGNGSVIHGTAIYNGNGFLNMLEGREQSV